MGKTKYITILFWVVLLSACAKQTGEQENNTTKTIKIWLIGDSTVADYSNNYDDGDYMKDRYPVTGWGQVFQPFVSGDNLKQLFPLLQADSTIVDDRARGGRSTRTFFQEGRWRQVYEALQPGDFVLMQFGHNDAAVNKTERYVNEEGYKEFLRLFILQTKQKQATPILLTPVARNYPWKNDTLTNVHGNYPQCVKEIADETQTLLIDLNQRSMEFFTEKGKDYVTNNYFMNLPAGKYEAYPDGQNDNTHLQPEGARAVSQLVYEGLLDLSTLTNTSE
ncbi:rhamnogalacturonan acetylesterase [Draconibacterium sp. IB214405]|uniref:rhamnogalacturonan acetylesterase n=1 Tax=Draconibacterium sp. IB214405 TaxID=3097352 RepID=UPI002A1596F7|nr:rhamnogalacturonan acetylesterase [Draconibacterium sp. IB214405]MDX8338926.1 rhamnogalacturonan acetylesterase [Draconibacterium sp. IB214405]